jgi:phosphoribosyl 1,2-cyclic phosphodiesterase
MKIKVWGSRGSIPSPGAETSRYGGNTTCVEIRLADGALLIIDAGTGIRKLGQSLVRDGSPDNLYLLLTHAHWDHLQGFPFFLPAYRQDFTLQVWGGPRAKATLRGFLEHQLDPPFFPVEFDDLAARMRFLRASSSGLTIGKSRIEPLPLSHPNGGYGFRFREDGRSFVFLTDNELGHDHPGGLSAAAYLEACRGADLLFHDAQYTTEQYRITRSWGHSTFQTATALALAAKVRRFGIFHHDPQHTDAQLDRLVQGCRDRISRERGRVDCFGVAEGMEIRL